MILPGQMARAVLERIFTRLALVFVAAMAVMLVLYGGWMWLTGEGQMASSDMPLPSVSPIPTEPGQMSSSDMRTGSHETAVLREMLPSATAYPTYTPYPTFTALPTYTPVPTEQGPLPSLSPLPSATPDYVALMQANLDEMHKDAEAARLRADADAAMWREVWRWACLAGLAPVAVLLTGLVVLALRKMAQGDDLMDADEADEPEAAPGPERVSLEVKTNGGKSLLWHRYPVDKRVMRQWIKVALNGGSIAIGNWAGSKKPFTRGSYEKFIDYWLTAGVLMDKYPGVENSERVLTEGGAAALEAVLAQEFGYV